VKNSNCIDSVVLGIEHLGGYFVTGQFNLNNHMTFGVMNDGDKLSEHI
jgi:hypothetical protein